MSCRMVAAFRRQCLRDKQRSVRINPYSMFINELATEKAGRSNQQTTGTRCQQSPRENMQVRRINAQQPVEGRERQQHDSKNGGKGSYGSFHLQYETLYGICAWHPA